MSNHVYVRPLTPRDLDDCLKITTDKSLNRNDLANCLASHSPTTLGIFTTPPVPPSTARPETPSLHPHEEIMVGYLIASLSKPEEEGGQGPFVVVRAVQGKDVAFLDTLVKSWVGRMRDSKMARKILVQEAGVGGEGVRTVWEKVGFITDTGGNGLLLEGL